MGNFELGANITFAPDSAFKYIKLPHFSLVNPFDIADLFHSHNKCSFDKAIRTIRDCIDWFTENSRDKLGIRKSAYTTCSGRLNSNTSLQSPSIHVRHGQNDSENNLALKDIYDGPWFPLA